MAQINMKDMLNAGVHFGHQTQRWNSKMKPFVYGTRGGIHIIDLQQTVAHAKKAVEFTKKVAANGGNIIFVGTKKQATETVQEAAQKCGQYYVTKRWLGGTLTNFTTIKMSIDRLKRIDRMREKGELEVYSKKERSKIEKEYERLCDYLNGIKDMKKDPAAIFVVDLNKEHIAVAEATRLKIPVIAIADTNTDPEKVEFPIPGNDDAIRSIKLFTNLIADAYNEGAKEWEVKKQSSANKETAPANKESKAAPEAASTGPAVVKVSGGRRIVAAGTAEDVEIAMELDSKTEEKTEE